MFVAVARGFHHVMLAKHKLRPKHSPMLNNRTSITDAKGDLWFSTGSTKLASPKHGSPKEIYSIKGNM